MTKAENETSKDECSFYSEAQARKLIIKAGLMLFEKGLVSRSWGNISARISAEECIITPSGRDYTKLCPEELVKLRISDCSYSGNIRPSSEKTLHAASYRLRSELRFIIHTHQFYASAVGIEGRPTAYAASGSYALPGTEALKDSMIKAAAEAPFKNAFLMPHHGVLCFGTSCEEAFEVSSELEAECRRIFEEEVPAKDFFAACIESMQYLPAYIDDFAQLFGRGLSLDKSRAEICRGEDADAVSAVLEKNCAAALYARAKGIGPLDAEDADRQREDYLNGYSKLIRA